MTPVEQFKADLDAKLAAMTPRDFQAVFERAGMEFFDPSDFKGPESAWLESSENKFPVSRAANSNKLALAA